LTGFEELASESPDDAAIRSNLVSCYTHLGSLLRETSRLRESEETHRRQLDLATRLVEDFPGRVDFQDRPASARCNLAYTLAASRNVVDAEAAYREVLLELGRLPADVRNRPQIRSLLALTQNDLGKLYREAGRPSEAEPAYREAAAGF